MNLNNLSTKELGSYGKKAPKRTLIFGTSGMSFVEKPPYFSCPNGIIGLLSSMFTENEYRRQGIAKELLSKVIKEAKVWFW